VGLNDLDVWNGEKLTWKMLHEGERERGESTKKTIKGVRIVIFFYFFFFFC
jgi:hypothetical protein